MRNKITIQPLFNYKNYLKSILGKNNENSLYLFKSGRYSLYFGLTKILEKNKKLRTILLPNLICDEIIAVFQLLNLEVKYYQLKDDLNPDLISIKNLLSKGNSILFVVNYFGFPSDWDTLNSIKEEFNCIMIEDNAHSLYSSYKNKKLGSFGDISFNSLRKTLPLLSGSELCFNNINCQDESIYKYSARFPNFKEIKYSLRQFKLKQTKKRNFNEEGLIAEDLKKPSIDIISKNIYRKITFNEQDILMRRSENFNFWKNYLNKEELNFFDELVLNDEVCPYVFPCYTKSLKDTKKWVEWGKERRVNIISWPKLPTDVNFSMKNEKLKNIILFPVNHQFDIPNTLI